MTVVSKAREVKILSASADRFRIVAGSFGQFVFSKHFHEEYTLGFLTGGREEFAIGNRVYQLGTGSTYFLNPGDSHSSGPADRKGWAYRSIYLDSGWLRSMMQQDSSVGEMRFHTGASSTKAHSQLASRLMHDLHGSKCRLEQETTLIGTMSQLLSVSTERESGKDDDRVTRMREFLGDQVEESFSLTQLAAEVEWHPMHALVMFRKKYGITPNAYLISCRLNRAVRLIMNYMPLVEVAVAAGFYDQSHLTRHFVRAFGTTPAAHRDCRTA